MFERGDLLLVPFPFTDLSTAKRRPVLAITSPDSYGDFIALPVTSPPKYEHGLSLSNENMLTGTLPAASWVRTNRIVTLNAKFQTIFCTPPSDNSARILKIRHPNKSG